MAPRLGWHLRRVFNSGIGRLVAVVGPGRPWASPEGVKPDLVAWPSLAGRRHQCFRRGDRVQGAVLGGPFVRPGGEVHGLGAARGWRACGLLRSAARAGRLPVGCQRRILSLLLGSLFGLAAVVVRRHGPGVRAPHAGRHRDLLAGADRTAIESEQASASTAAAHWKRQDRGRGPASPRVAHDSTPPHCPPSTLLVQRHRSQGRPLLLQGQRQAEQPHARSDGAAGAARQRHA
mmetsp:Transcript_156890/g.503560  ORF Transcript_156890/g.503560 Transcript_156890/m.503560 type:complete len:233 (-) Transcript_156890:99-797(-)